MQALAFYIINRVTSFRMEQYVLTNTFLNPVCSVTPPGERVCVRERENKPHVTDIASVLSKAAPRSYSNIVI